MLSLADIQQQEGGGTRPLRSGITGSDLDRSDIPLVQQDVRDALSYSKTYAMRSIRRRDTGESYREMLTRMAQESGCRTRPRPR